jgi:hypothetical protein
LRIGTSGASVWQRQQSMIDERARRGDAQPVLQEALPGVERDARPRVRRARRVAAAARHGEQLRAQRLDQIVRRQPRAFETLRGASDLGAIEVLEPFQRRADAARARARQIEIARAQVIPPACGVLVVFVQSRRQLCGERLARQPGGAPGARRFVQRGVEARFPPRQPRQIGAPHTAETGPEPHAGTVRHAMDHRGSARGRTRVAA